MPRKSLAEERSHEILDAFERCILKYGFGASLEQIAEEAGMKRSILRHYIGNRDQIIKAMAERFALRYRAQLKELAAYITGEKQHEQLLKLLFVPTSKEEFTDVVIMEALIAASVQLKEIQTLMSALVKETVKTVNDILANEFPDVDTQLLWSVSYAVVSIYFNHASMQPLTLPKRYTLAARQSAMRLIETLAN